MDYKRHKKVIQGKTETVREIFEIEVPKNEKEYKTISNYLKRLKKIPRKNIFKKKLAFKNDIKNTLKTLKDVIGKTKINENRLPKKTPLGNKKITDRKTIAEKFNEFYVNVGPNLDSKISQNNNDYKSYLPDITTLFD